MVQKTLTDRELVEVQIRAQLFRIRPESRKLALFLHTTHDSAQNLLSNTMGNIKLNVLKKWLRQLKKVN